MTRQELADRIEELDAAMRATTTAEDERKLHTELADLIEGDNLRTICAALRRD